MPLLEFQLYSLVPTRRLLRRSLQQRWDSSSRRGRQKSPLCIQTSSCRGICHSRDFYPMLEALEAQSLRSSWVGGNSPSRGSGPIAGPAREPAWISPPWPGSLVWKPGHCVGEEPGEESAASAFTSRNRQATGAEVQRAGGTGASPGATGAPVAAELWTRNRCRQLELLHCPQHLHFLFPYSSSSPPPSPALLESLMRV